MNGKSNRRLALGAAAIAALSAGPALAQAPVVITGLSAPRGLTASGDSVLVAVQGDGSILRIAADGTVTPVAEGLRTAQQTDPDGNPSTAGAAVAIETDAGVFYLSNVADCYCLMALGADGASTALADLGAYEAEHNTDGLVVEGTPELESNPFDLVSDGADGFFVTDAAANAVLHVTADGTISPFYVFPRRANPLAGMVGAPDMDPVPTGLERGPDGALYVTSMTGFPFPEGGSVVYRLEDTDGDGTANGQGEVTPFAEGLTMAIQLAFDGDDALLVSEFSLDMLNNGPGRVVRIANGETTEVAAPLISPTGLAVLGDDVIVTQEFLGIVAEAGAAAGIAASPPPAQ